MRDNYIADLIEEVIETLPPNVRRFARSGAVWFSWDTLEKTCYASTFHVPSEVWLVTLYPSILRDTPSGQRDTIRHEIAHAYYRHEPHHNEPVREAKAEKMARLWKGQNERDTKETKPTSKGGQSSRGHAIKTQAHRH